MRVLGFVSVVALAACARSAPKLEPLASAAPDAAPDAAALPGPAEASAPTPSPSPPPAPSAPPAPASSVAIGEMATLVTTSGPPSHVRLTARPTGAASARVHVESVTSREPRRRVVTIVGLAVDGRPAPVGTDVVAPPDRTTEIVVTFDAGPDALPAAASAYPFTVALRVDGAPREVDVIVRRAERRRLP